MKRPVIEEKLESSVQDYANKNHNGNFTEAVNAILESVVVKIKIEESKK